MPGRILVVVMVLLVLALVMTGHEDFLVLLATGGWEIVSGVCYAVGFGLLFLLILVVAAAC